MQVKTLFELAGPALLAFALCLLTGPWIIRLLQKLKFGQVIRGEGPEWHAKKEGTPPMGGLIFTIGLVAATAVFTRHMNAELGGALMAFLGFALIGFLDDMIKARKKQNLGLRAWQKAGLQLLLSVGLVIYLGYHVGTSIRLPFTQTVLDLGWFYYPFAVFVIVATVNGTNLTDGLDGLLGSTALVYFLSYALIFFTSVLPVSKDLMIVCMAMAGALLGFLRFNVNPARVFMGDTGSLALGGLVCYVSLYSGTVLWIPVMGGVFVASVLSVVLQVGSYKLRHGKRIFKMAPLHHHFELCGYSETYIVAMYTIVTAVLCFIGLMALR